MPKIAAIANTTTGRITPGRRLDEEKRRTERTMMVQAPAPTEVLAIEEASTADIVREAFEEAKELVRIEVALAKTEVVREISRAKRAAIALAIAVSFALVVLCMLAVAIVLALGGAPEVALGVAAIVLLVAIAAGAAGYSMLPKKPLEHTLGRLKADVTQLKEHIA